MLPDHFYANVLSKAFPPDHTYMVALFEEHQTMAHYSPEGECDGIGYEAKVLTGYTLVDAGDHAVIKFDPIVDWTNADIRTQAAVIFDANTDLVLSIMNFERPVGVIGGLFTLKLHEEGVIKLGHDPVEIG